MPKILLVEDESAIAEGLMASLEADGFRPVWVSSGDQAISAWQQERPDLVLLDLMLPGTSGTEVCRRLRASSNVPIIMVTARGGEVDRVVGLELGADDYVTKPFSTRELIARIRAVLRRDVRTGAVAPDGAVEAAGVRVDPARREVTVSGHVLELPPKEFDLLEVLVRNAGLVCTRTHLIHEVWGHDYVGDTRTLDVHIGRLRRRIEQDPHHPTLIRTVRGVGYRFAGR